MRPRPAVDAHRSQRPISVKTNVCRLRANHCTGLERTMTTPLIERFRAVLPVSGTTPVVSLGEGSTPLLPAPRLAEASGVRELWLKWEASNPTGSYKDRGMTVAVSKALEARAEAVLCASTGNTSASAAAY